MQDFPWRGPTMSPDSVLTMAPFLSLSMSQYLYFPVYTRLFHSQVAPPPVFTCPLSYVPNSYLPFKTHLRHHILQKLFSPLIFQRTPGLCLSPHTILYQFILKTGSISFIKLYKSKNHVLFFSVLLTFSSVVQRTEQKINKLNSVESRKTRTKGQSFSVQYRLV